MLFFYIYIEMFYLLVSPKCEGLRMLEDSNGIDESPWNPNRVREWACYRLIFFYIIDVT